MDGGNISGGLFGNGGAKTPMSPAPGYASSPPGGGYTSNYANSGLARFSSIQPYQPPEYRPQLFQPAPLAARRDYPAAGGLLMPSQDSGTQAFIDAGGAGSSGIGGIGTAGGSSGQNADGSPVGAPSVGTIGNLGSIGLGFAVGGLPGAIGQAVSIGQSASAPNTTPASDDGTTQGISDAIGQMGMATDDGTTDGINATIGEMGDPGDGSGGGAGGK